MAIYPCSTNDIHCIDDGFGLWEQGLEELMRFEEYANQIHTNIKVELRWNVEAIEVLDTWVRIEEGKIVTDLYTTPTEEHLYVNCKTSHPGNVKKAIPYGLGMRNKENLFQRGRLQASSW